MLTRRIIACLDVAGGKVVKGIRFASHRIVGDIVALASRHRDAGVDELVFYDIEASPSGRRVDPGWIERVSRAIDIPFCVAGGIRSVADARCALNAGADKVSINSPALERPDLIEELAEAFGSQCVVVGVDSKRDPDRRWHVRRNSGDPARTETLAIETLDWIATAQARGAGEIVLNSMSSDGTRDGYDIAQLKAARALCEVPLIASGGAGSIAHFREVFEETEVDGALAASVFHDGLVDIGELKRTLQRNAIDVRLGE
ncbi:MAG TPA: imidazole glycerol phosphate synthase subunit HisF [Rhodanobacteraceae bacterium]|jgi:cyclase|nr:imidazole glycerol phosphate synthase subunit HisF [Rhodanobacteraceae bacterium]